ncbi:MAG: hypothetical protein WBN59_11970 [Flavobacteriaceae bacterium]
MKQRRYILILIFTGFIIDGSFAQELRTQFGDVYYDVNMHRGQYNGTLGSPYLNEVFVPCKINEIPETQLARFNAYNGTVEVKISKTKVVLLGDAVTYIIRLNDGSGKTYYTGNYYDSKGELKNSFFELIHESDAFDLYLKEKIKYNKAVKAEGYKDAEPPSFKKADGSYFITDLWEKTPRLVLLPKRTSAFMELFPGQAKALKKFSREQKLKLDNAEDLVQIINHALLLN